MINQQIDQLINQLIDQSANRSAENMTKNFTYTLENFTRSNLIKKRKSDDLEEIPLFAPSLNRQKVNTKLQEAKAAMLTAYAIAENSHMLSIVDQINQLINDSKEIVKTNITIKILMMQIKLNIIIKNQNELIKNQTKTKSETTKIEQNPNKQHISKSLQPPQIKPPTQQQFGPPMAQKITASIKTSMIFVIFIITAKTAAKTAPSTAINTNSWAQVVSKKTIKKIQKINQAETIKNAQIQKQMT